MRQQPFKIKSRAGLEWLASSTLNRHGWLLHAFSTRLDGRDRKPSAALNLGFTKNDPRPVVEKNRERFFRQLGAEGFVLAELRQTHSAKIHRITRGAAGKLEYRPCGYALPPGYKNPRPEGDALFTDEPGILISVRSADCMPILVADPKRRAVAAIHAGWRGALERIIEKTIGEMVRVFGSQPRDLLAAVGPSIRACCYEVGEEVLSAFCGRFKRGEDFFREPPEDKSEIARRHPLLFLTRQPPGHGPHATRLKHLDLAAVARGQLLSAGARATNIQVADFCTACRTDLFFSHRREGSRAGRMMAVIAIRPREGRVSKPAPTNWRERPPNSIARRRP